ncbi:hypothetical protein ACFS07_36610 [Undibacterium arcticum]
MSEAILARCTNEPKLTAAEVFICAIDHCEIMLRCPVEAYTHCTAIRIENTFTCVSTEDIKERPNSFFYLDSGRHRQSQQQSTEAKQTP